MHYPICIVSDQKEESIRIQMVKVDYLHHIFLVIPLQNHIWKAMYMQFETTTWATLWQNQQREINILSTKSFA